MWEFDLSARAANCLRRANINLISDLVAASQEELLKVPNLGRKTIKELRRLLRDLALDFGLTTKKPTPNAVGPFSTDAQQDLDLAVTTVDTLDLSVGARNVLRAYRIHTLGQLVSLSPDALLSFRSCGHWTVQEIERKLDTHGLHLKSSLKTLDPSGSSMSPRRGKLTDNQKAQLVRAVSELKLSVRAKNVLQRVGVNFLGDLVQMNPQDLMRLRNCSERTLVEIEGHLKKRGLRLGMWVPEWNEKTRTSLIEKSRHLTSFQKAQLVRAISEHDWSVRTRNGLERWGVNFVGDLVKMTPPDLMSLQNFGARSLVEIERHLQKCGLYLGMRIDEWNEETRTRWLGESRQRLQRIRETEALAALEVDGKLPQTLEEELSRFVGAYVDKRRVGWVTEYYGWSGEAPKTLEEVGCKHGVTRERVRQVLARFHKKIEPLPVYLPILDRSLTFVSGCCPMLAQEAESRLVSAGVCAIPMRIEGLLSAAKIAGRSVDFVVCELPEGRVVGPNGVDKRIRISMRAARRLVSKLGCGTLDEIQSPTLQAAETSSLTDVLSFVLEAQEGFRWLDREGGWFWFTDVSRNCLLNRIRKALAVTVRVPIGELRASVSRDYRMGGMAPPRHVLEEFCRQLPECRIVDSVVERTKPIDARAVLSKSEYKLMEVLRSADGVMSTEDLESHCRARGMSMPIMWNRLGYSPIISKLTSGLYCLVGSDVEPGEVEEHLRKRRHGGRLLLDYGWTQGGAVWLAYKLSRASVQTGVFKIPASFRGLLEGEHELNTLDGSSFGKVFVKGTSLYGMKKFFNRRGGEPEDILVVTIAPGAETATVRIGDEGLLDECQSPMES